MENEKKKKVRDFFLEMLEDFAFGISTDSTLKQLQNGNPKLSISDGIVTAIYLARMIFPQARNVLAVPLAAAVTANLAVTVKARKEKQDGEKA